MAYADPDLILLRRFTEKGDQKAFSEIVQRYAGMVFTICRRILNDRARAEEVSQETFFRLMTRPQSVSQSLGGWLHCAATRLAVDERRSETSRRRRESEVAKEAREADEPTQLRWAEISPHIDEALARVPDESRLLLIGHFLEGRLQQELAKEAGVSAATISRRIKQAADELRRELRRGGVDVMPSTLLGMWAMHAVESAPIALQHELSKMAMISGMRLAANKTLYAVSRRAVSALQVSAESRWSTVALALSGLIVSAIVVGAPRLLHSQPGKTPSQIMQRNTMPVEARP